MHVSKCMDYNVSQWKPAFTLFHVLVPLLRIRSDLTYKKCKNFYNEKYWALFRDLLLIILCHGFTHNLNLVYAMLNLPSKSLKTWYALH